MSAGEVKKEATSMFFFMSRRKRIAAALVAGLAAASLFAGCSSCCDDTAKQSDPSTQETSDKAATIDLSNAKDGTYQAESSANDTYGHGKIAITIQDHNITNCTYFGIDKEGALKGEEYGKKNGQITNEQTYKKAQNAVKANATYAKELVEKQQLSEVDAISGATISYEQFAEAAQKAIEEAKK